MASLSADAALFADGGYIQLGAIADGVMIDAFPSNSAQVILRNMQFTANTLSPRPRIRFGPSKKDAVVGQNFRVKILDCTGLYPDQFQLEGRLWARVPESRGEVEFQGSADQAYHFHNFLRMNPASAQTLDTTRVDLTVADNAPATINAPGPLGIQWTSAKVHAGSGSPENAIAATIGSLYLRTDRGTGSTLYVKESGTEKNRLGCEIGRCCAHNHHHASLSWKEGIGGRQSTSLTETASGGLQGWQHFVKDIQTSPQEQNQ